MTIFGVVITDTEKYRQKINAFLKDRHFLLLPASIYHKQIQQTLQQNTTVTPSQLKAQFRIHKEDIQTSPFDLL
jgi:exopolysaccharide biosynthesis predicted pyruvyltransferase EpsI